MLVALLFAASVASGNPDVAGLWRTPVHNGLVEISHCGAELCGRLLTSDRIRQNPSLPDAKNEDQALRSRPLKGLQLFKGFKGSGGSWHDGAMYNPDDGHTYHGGLELDGPDRLKVTGCIFAPLCKTQVWVRAPADAASK